MSAFGTEKVQTNELNLGFPRAFSEDYAKHGPSEQYSPDNIRGGLNNTVGHDTQALWHQQKMKDAHHMANAKVRSTIISAIRAYSSANNRPDHQQPVLGQRRFANPSNGALDTASARLDQLGSPWTLYRDGQLAGAGMYGSVFRNTPKGYVEPPRELVGGVVRTSAGQRFVYDRLQDRINQLNAIAESKQAFDAKANVDVPYAGAQPTYKDSLTTGQDVELAQTLQSILFALTSYQSALRASLFTDVNKAFVLIVKMATTMEAADIANVLEAIEGTGAQDGIIPMAENQIAIITDQGLGQDSASNRPRNALGKREQIASAQYADVITHIGEFFDRIVIYLREMMKYVGRPLRDRVSASNAMIKSLQFAKYNMGLQSIARTASQPEEFIDNDNFFRQADRNAGPGFSGAFISPTNRNVPLPGGRQFPRVTWGGEVPERFSSGTSTPYSTFQRREDSQQGTSGPTSVFDESTTEQYANSSGQYLQDTGVRPGGRQTAYFGEAPMNAQDLQAQQLARSQFDSLRVPLLPISVPGTSEARTPSDAGNSYFGLPSSGPSSVAPPGMRAIQDPVTGQANIVVPAPDQHANEAPQARAKHLPAPAQARQKWKESDVPTDYRELIDFSKEVKKVYPTIAQVYNVARSPEQIVQARKNLIAYMKQDGAISV